MPSTIVDKSSTSKRAPATHNRATDTRSDYQVVKDHGYNSQYEMIMSYGMNPSKEYDGESGWEVGKKIVEGFRRGDAVDRDSDTNQGSGQGGEQSGSGSDHR